MRRRILRISIVLLALLIFAVVAIQIVLWTAVPKRIVIDQLQKEMGLRVNADSVSTSWLGHTELRDVTLALPLSTDSLLDVPEIRVSHSWLPTILLGGNLTIQSIELRSPKMVVRQEPTGRWNFQDVADLISGASGGNSTQATSSSPRYDVNLPSITVTGGSLRVIDRTARETTIAPIDFTGRPQSTLAWQFDSSFESRAKLSGEIAPGGPWRHAIKFDFQNIGPWVSTWVKNWPSDARTIGTWRGQKSDDGFIIGRLDIEKSYCTYESSGRRESAEMRGALEVKGEASGTRLRPQQFVIKTSDPRIPEMRLDEGALVVAGDRIAASALQVALPGGGLMHLTGDYNWTDDSANLKAAWEEAKLPQQGITHRGELSATLRMPWPGQPAITCDLKSHGGGEDLGSWEGALNIRGEGKSWDAIDWSIRAPQLVLHRPRRNIDLSQLVAEASTRGKKFTLVSLSLPEEGKVDARGMYDLADNAWWLYVQGRSWQLTRGSPISNVIIDAWGNPERSRLKQLYLMRDNVALSAEGVCLRQVDKPVSINVHMWTTAYGRAAENELPIRGKIHHTATVTGSFEPLDLHFNGTSEGRELFVEDQSMGDILVEFSGRIENDRVWAETQKLHLLGGNGSMRATFPFDGKSLGIDLTLRDVAIKELGELVHQPNSAGTFGGSWHMEFPSLKKNGVEVDGTFSCDNVKLARFTANRIDGSMRLRDGLFKVDPIRFREQDGSANASVSLDISAPMAITATVNAAAWPATIDRNGTITHINLWGGTTLQIDTRAMAVTGPVRIDRANVTVNENYIGDLTLQADLRGRTIAVNKLQANLLGGVFDAQATVDVDHLLATSGWLKWRDIDSTKVAPLLIANWQGLTGKYAGSFVIAPTTEPRPLEPLMVHADLQPSADATVRGVPIGDCRFHGYANIDRVVLVDDPRNPTTLKFAGGSATVFARLSKHLEKTYSLQMQSHFKDVSLDQLVHASDPKSQPMPGVLSGDITLFGNPRHMERMYGQATINITQTDLANSDPIAVLYDMMNLGKNEKGPTGKAKVEMRLENSDLYIDAFRLFNRGVEIRAAGLIKNVWAMPDCPLDVSAVGSARPLKDLKIPFMGDADQIFTALQGSLTSVRVEGTVRDPKTVIVSLDNLNTTMRAILLGDLQSEKQQQN